MTAMAVNMAETVTAMMSRKVRNQAPYSERELRRGTKWGPIDEDIAAVEAFVAKSLGPVLDVAFPFFSQVAADMRTQAGVAGFSLEAACARALSHFE